MLPNELASKPPDELARWLVELARDARLAWKSDDLASLTEQVLLVREAAQLAAGMNRDLLEVADAFLRVFTQKHLGRRELAVRHFLKETGDAGADLLARLLDRGIEIESSDAKNHEASLQKLVDPGVVRTAEGYWVIVPEAFAPVRDLVTPLAFRLWARVEDARRDALGQQTQSAELLAGRLGVLVEEARRFLRHYPLRRPPPRATATHESVFSLMTSGNGDQPETETRLQPMVDATEQGFDLPS